MSLFQGGDISDIRKTRTLHIEELKINNLQHLCYECNEIINANAKNSPIRSIKTPKHLK